MKKRMITILLGVLLIAGLVFALPSSVSGCGQETLRIGYTLYEPMNYLDESGELTGHDTEFAEMACEELGYTPEFIRIEWSKKIIELESGRIDLIWNGMTITDELKDAMLISDPYMVNQQVIVGTAVGVDGFQHGKIVQRLHVLLGQAGEGDLGGFLGVGSSLEGNIPQNFTAGELLSELFVMFDADILPPQIQLGTLPGIQMEVHNGKSHPGPYYAGNRCHDNHGRDQTNG